MGQKNLLNKIAGFIITAVFITAGNLGEKLFAQTYTYTPASTISNAFPLSSATSNMVQWLFDPSDFSPTVPGGVNITTIYIQAGSASTSGGTFTNLQIKMGNSSLSCLTSGTWNSGLTTVYFSSSHTISSWTTTGWIPITLQTPFFYSGTSPFILEISQSGYTTGMSVKQGTPSCNRRMYGSSANTTSTGSDARLLMFGFDTSPANCSGTPTAPTISTAAMNTAAPLCATSTMTLNGSYPSPLNGITYQWQSATSSTGPFTNVTTGTGGTTLSYTTAPTTVNTYYRLATICSNSGLANYSAPYLVIIGSPQPGAITGNATFCPGNPITYSVPAVTGTTYAWTLPSGWSGTSTTSSITATPNNTAGNISVVATSSCGTSIAQTYAVLPGSAPAQPGTISGNAPICGNTSQTYSVLPVTGATSYTWTLPSGWTGTSSTNTITTTAGNSGGTVAVTANNGCGPSSVRNLTVNVITALANPGTITGPTTTCSGVMYNYSINPVPGATSYTWTFPSGWSGTTSGTSIQAFPSTTSGNVNVTAFVSCATSPTSSQAVTVTPTLTPSVSIATPVTTICQGVPITFTATPVNGGTTPLYQWKKNGVNVAGAGTTYLNNGLVTGDVITVEMTSTYACPSSTTATSNAITASVTPSVVPGINISTTPTVNICKGTPLTFNTNITGGGSSPSYQWYKNGNILGGATSATYTDATLVDKDTLSVKLSSNAVCATSPSVMSNKVLVAVTDVVVPSIVITASSTIINGAPITFTAVQSGGGTTPQYQWMKNNVAIPLATGDSYTASAASLKNGDRITVRMLSLAQCATPEIVTSNEIAVSSPLSIAGVGGWDGSIGLYPNPTTGKFTIGASWGNAHIGKRVAVDVMNAVGQGVYHSEVAPDRAEWHYDVQLAEGLANGSYMLRISGDGMKATIPFILNR